MTITAVEVLSMLKGRRRFLFQWTSVCCAVAWPVVFLLPRTYVATAVILPPQQPASAAALLATMNPMGALAARDLGLKNPADMYVGLLAGRTIADAIIARHRLREAYKTETDVDTRRELARRTTITTGRDTLIRISVQDRNAARAAAISNSYVSELQQQGMRLAVSEASSRREFFERQVEAEKILLADAEAALKATQERTGLVQVSSQAEATMRAIAQTRAQVTAHEVRLRSLRLAATDENPEVLRERAALEALRGELTNLEARSGGGLVSPHQLPASGLEYVRRMREVKYREAVVELLLKQYEAARFDEAKAAPPIQVVDQAVPPDLAQWPPRAAFLALSPILFFLALSSFVVARAVGQSASLALHTERVVVRQL